MNILLVETGIFGEHSQSTQLARKLADRLVSKQSTVPGNITQRDLIANPLPYFDGSVAMAMNTPEEQRDEAQKAVVALSDSLIQEITDADAIVLGVPMYNFGVPAQMKTWFDYLARVGVTFRYTENGPEGLIGNKPVYVVAARGGVHIGQPSDTQSGFIQTILGFIGLTDVRMVYAEGLNMGDEAKAASLEKFDRDAIELV